MIVVGLTGGIATGKSTAATFLQGIGAPIVDADGIGHLAYQPQTEPYRQVVAAFGTSILGPDGTIDRAKLGEVVFSDAEAMGRLNAIMRPAMLRIVEQRLQELREQGAKAVVLEAALLIEAGWTHLTSQVWVTAAPEEVVIRRLMARNTLTETQARARLASQMPLEDKMLCADVVISTDCSFDEVRQQVEHHWRALTAHCEVAAAANSG